MTLKQYGILCNDSAKCHTQHNDPQRDNKDATFGIQCCMLSVAFCIVTLSKMTLKQYGILCNDSAKCHTQHNDLRRNYKDATLGIQCCYAKSGILHCHYTECRIA